ncbi:quinone-dependent dihydroorotate dehydrogenase [Candidatus Mycobacterium methanotrophicum]|uniref:Dihydroorotate dehydrogenase (quinone) n=1 Tax=Candidatus Mycobacterium methanotrophicum TaxID=2943498 RepID=A0ABY4QG63_9MYCO|nr:quinone-dependent dihydroorotate dehydrogenase [Candidatus Mycobacterium methanotrophicum]UQX09368.1 quinone-dependent dihydroorotate dehydrogenase [Candidatus Mycobacterium methanotrophicum]
MSAPPNDPHQLYGVLRRLLFVVPPERSHELVFAALRAVTAAAPLRRTLSSRLAPTDPVLASTVFGVRFPGPLGLAAGFDKDGAGLKAWGAMGFGYAEVGTVTAHAQPGNPAPRLFRLPADRALLNRMGFNNRGAAALASRLTRQTPDVPIGVNIGKTKSTPPEHAADDYRVSARLVGPLAAYLVANVSSPNTPGLRDLQAVDSLREIMSAVLDETSTPVLVKIAPDLADSDLDEIADLAIGLGLAGIVATNTTVSREGLCTPGVDALGSGGISGPPLAHRAAEVLRRLHGRVGDRLTLISVGGIETVDDAWDRITAGASLLQGYTGFIYGGGLWAKHIHDGIALRLREGGFSSLSEAVGSG